MHRICIFLICIPFSIFAQVERWTSSLVVPDGNGCFVYPADEEQNRIPDFSYAGYKGGGVALPQVPTVLEISPIEGDNTQHIQAAIDSAGRLPLNADGFRGALLLKAGVYAVHGSIYVNKSGVVLRGVGDGYDDSQATVIMGVGDIPHQRDLIVLGGGVSTQWAGQLAGTKQNILTDFVPVGAHRFEVEDASLYEIGDNIIIYHPCTDAWLSAVGYGETNGDLQWTVGQFPIIFNRYVTAIVGDTITVDAPVYNHLDRSLSQSYVYKYDRAGLVTNVGLENILVDNENAGGEDENHVRNCVQLTQVEDAWLQNCSMYHFVLSGVRTETASRITVRNCRSFDPVAIVDGGRMYNFNSYAWSNNILFDNCHARNGRHHFVSNGITSVSGFVVLRSVSENPYTASEGHRHWTTGMLFDNVVDFGRIPSMNRSMGFYNRGDYGSGHGWSAAHSVFWGCSTKRIGSNADIVVEKPPTAQNYAIGCFGNVHGDGPFHKSEGYIEGSNRYDAQLYPQSLYEAQLLCRKDAVIADFNADHTVAQIKQNILFTAECKGDIGNYDWDFGVGADPQTATGVGPHQVSYASVGAKTVSLKVRKDGLSHTEIKYALIDVLNNGPHAVNDSVEIAVAAEAAIPILENDSWTDFQKNSALEFDGVDDYARADGGAVSNVYPFTMMAWVKTESQSEDVVLYIGNKNSGISGNSIGVYAGKARLQASLWNGEAIRATIDSDVTVNDNEWHHIAGVFTAPDSRSLYVDGALEAADTVFVDNLTNQAVNATSLGNRDDSSPSHWFSGSLDEAVVLNKALNSDEIITYMNMPRFMPLENTVVHWGCDEGTGEVLHDRGTNAYTASLNGAKWVARNSVDSLPIVSLKENPKNGTCELQDGRIIYTPNVSYVGYDSLVYSITDESSFSSEAAVFITIGEPEAEQIINLQKGWNLVSLYLEPAIADFGSVFPHAQIVKTLNHFWDANLPVYLNGLKNIQVGAGYLLYNAIDEELVLTGRLVEHDAGELQQGWNLIGVPSSMAIPVSDIHNVSVIKSFEGVYEPLNLMSTLKRLEAGKAYFVKVD